VFAASVVSNTRIARDNARVVGTRSSASPQISPVRASRARIESTVNALNRSRLVSSRGASGADTGAFGLARTL
jgi:hypothetical protein